MNVFKLEAYLGCYEFSARYLLCCSDAESVAMSEVLQMASPQELSDWESLSLGYTEVPGRPALRAMIADQLYTGLTANNILCFAGAEDAIFSSLSTLISAGDHVIVLTPCYQSLLEIPKSRGACVSEIALEEKNNWRIDFAKIESCIQSSTKCVIINFPHNPTGQVIEPAELLLLIELCKKHGIYLFSDEVYRLLGDSDGVWAEPVACLYEKGISVGVMSKVFGAPGLRIGWLACQDQALLKRFEHMKHYTSICNSASSEILALIILRNKKLILERNNAIVDQNLKLLDAFFAMHHELFSWVSPRGGCVGFVRYKGSMAVEAFCDLLLKKRGVLLLPGIVYDCDTPHFRIGFGRKNMCEALSQLAIFLKEDNI